ncbi:MAG: ABC transporter ATP-binding protein [Eubacteriales bacterium]
MELTTIKIEYSIDHKDILNKISLQVPQNKFVGLIGPNGSGKTTFLRCIYGALHPSKGEILLNDAHMNELSHKEIARKMAVLRQESSTDFDYTVEEIVAMGRFAHHKLLEAQTKEDVEVIRDSLIRVGMLERKDSYLSTLSGGEKQRVLIARALAQESKFLVLDEPTNHLDIYYKLQILSLIKSLGITVISAIHDIDLACKYCDYIHVIHKGRIVASGTPQEVVTTNLMEDIFQVHANITKSKDGETIAIEYVSPCC